MKRVTNSVQFAIAALFASGLCAPTAHADNQGAPGDIIAIGPLELIESQSVTVLGRSYHTEDTSGLVAGDKVAVHGNLMPDGSANNVRVEALGSYVAGSDQVFETGVVSDVKSELGRLTMGGSEVDYTNALANAGTVTPTVGAVVSVSGTQPVADGVVVSTTTTAGNEEMRAAYFGAAQAASINGGGARSASINGGGAATASINGGGARTASFTGFRAQ